MHCPVCLKKDTKVLDSRTAADGYAVRRRRQCENCGFRFSTYEEVELLNISVIKRDGRYEAYNREKLAKGLSKALEKRSYTKESLHKLLNHIERDIQRKRKDEITSNEIGEIAIRHLKKFDNVAYVRFTSAYYSFENIKSFEKELKSLLLDKKSKR